jgi:phage terminase small subunit
MRGQSEAEVVVIEGTGDGCSEAKKMMKAPEEKERLKAAELLGKRYSLFSDKVNLEGAVPVVFSGEDQLEE